MTNISDEQYIQKLNNTLYDIIVKNEKKYNKLFELFKIKDLVSREANIFSRKNNVDFGDVKNVCRIIIWEEVKDGGFKIYNEKEIAYDFLARMAIIMQDRLYGRYKEITGKRKSKYKVKEVSLEAIGLPPEKLNEEFIESDFEDKSISTYYMNNFKEKLSKREKEVFELRYRNDYTQEKIADILNLAQSTINVYQKRVWKKFKDYVG